MRKIIQVKTDDSQNKTFNLVVTGQVDLFAEITPQVVALTGKAGDKLESIVSITPSEKYVFTVLGLEKKNNSKIEATLIPPKKGSKVWQIKIKCHSDKVADLFEELILKTDSKYVPSFGIRVSAVFLEKKKAK
jgi:hypothetical protein